MHAELCLITLDSAAPRGEAGRPGHHALACKEWD